MTVNDSLLETVVVVSTRTRDCLPRGDGHVLEIPGGPAHYMAVAFAQLGQSFRVVTGESVSVEVLQTGCGEEYVIPALPTIPLDSRDLIGAAVILSPIMQEIDPNNVPPITGLLVVDLQGFVREPLMPTGSTVRTFDLSTLLQRADVVKASESELGRLDARSRDRVERGILLVTEGRRGAILRQYGQEHRIAAEPVQVDQAIGAGDTFLAAYVSALVKGKSYEEAGHGAARFTEQVLRARL